MRFSKETLITAFALFSLFFGAGNLILPPFLGFNAGTDWSLVTIGFVISAVLIPILGIVAHAKLQGTMLDFGNKVHPIFSLIFCILVYAISISLPAPRTASVTYEMAILPYLDWSSLLFSTLYFAMVLLFALNRSRLLNIIGKYLTPAIILILITILGIAIFGPLETFAQKPLKTPFTDGLLEGYQTFDAIGAVVVGAVVIISLNLKNITDYKQKQRLIIYGGILAGLGLLIIYAGLVYVGSLYGDQDSLTSRTQLLTYISNDTLGSGGQFLLAILFGLACFTTAVGIVTGTADFVKGLFKGSPTAYVITVFLGCFLGVLIGQFEVGFIIDVAVPALYFIYPITITLIVLNILPKQSTSILVFRGVVITVLLFSIPDFLQSLNINSLEGFKQNLPLAKYGVTWVVPALVVYIILKSIEIFSTKKTNDKTEL